jgi:hypothetical protein
MTEPSPLGRYADDGPAAPGGPGADALVEVHLLRLPVAVLVASRERHDSLLRECALLAAQAGDRPDLPPALVDLVMTLGVRYGAVRPRPDAIIEQALEEGRDVIDVTYRVGPTVPAAAERLERLMAAADEFCTSGHLLTLPRNPLERRFSDWYLEQFTAQVAGAPPRAWDGPLVPPA